MRALILALALLAAPGAFAATPRIVPGSIVTGGFTSVSSATLSSYSSAGVKVRSILCVVVGIENATSVFTNSVTWNSASLTEHVELNVGGFNTLAFYCTPNVIAVGATSDIVASLSGTATGVSVQAFIVENVRPTPTATASASASSATSITTAIVTVRPLDFIIDAVTHNVDIQNPATTEAGQTERSQLVSGSGGCVTVVSDKNGAAAPGSTNMGWNGFSGTGRQAHALVAFRRLVVMDPIGSGLIPGER